MSSIAERLLVVRGKTKQGLFAAKLGINPNTLRGYESGRVLPNFDVLAKVCVEYSIEPAWLILGIEPMKSQAGHEKPAKYVRTPAGCPHCLELYAKLVRAQDHEIELLEENSALKAENKALRDRLSPSASDKDSLENTA
jgi:transcriptional regulator with XRE-family HTH domain